MAELPRVPREVERLDRDIGAIRALLGGAEPEAQGRHDLDLDLVEAGVHVAHGLRGFLQHHFHTHELQPIDMDLLEDGSEAEVLPAELRVPAFRSVAGVRLNVACRVASIEPEAVEAVLELSKPATMRPGVGGILIGQFLLPILCADGLVENTCRGESVLAVRVDADLQTNGIRVEAFRHPHAFGWLLLTTTLPVALLRLVGL